ncbi:MAG: HAMP domain-containing histidine kinase [Deltaproteobacteria bacterium]|nr:HAMP domain-containing histidine kinase [Deltaproteobacteria bacterium]MBN2670449.1 HAMP domain-containing histidine kinase [Deltaproteobacteria bacterium]
MSNDLQKWIDVQTGLSKLYIHDFKNPISAIAANISYLEAVLDDAEEDVLGAVSDSSVALKMLLHMLDNYLNISRLESREQIEPVPVPLDRFIEEIMAKLKKMFTTMEPMVVLGAQVPSEMCFWPVTYAKLAVENLILQSMHNTPGGGKVLIDIRIDSRMVEIRVSDNGVRIDPSIYDQSFSREFQYIAKSREDARYGRAMAFYAVGLATEYMNGTVAISSENNLQVFTLRLPIEVPL